MFAHKRSLHAMAILGIALALVISGCDETGPINVEPSSTSAPMTIPTPIATSTPDVCTQLNLTPEECVNAGYHEWNCTFLSDHTCDNECDPSTGTIFVFSENSVVYNDLIYTKTSSNEYSHFRELDYGYRGHFILTFSLTGYKWFAEVTPPTCIFSVEFTLSSSSNIGSSDVPIITNDESRIRYILADIQLGDVADYYHQFTDDPIVAEALSRWDAGVRVQNIDQFERKIVNGEWKVVYAGTETIIDGMDVVLTGE